MLGHGERGGVGIGAARTVNVFLSGAGPLVAARSAYLAQVRRIAPPQLRDRDTELAELAGFCLQEHRGPYVWWQAGPWAGKSALLSTFVLRPPDEVRSRVQVVAFFITARLAGQDTRAAFVAAVTEQLTALTGEQPPAVTDEGLREAWLLDLLAQAAEACRQRHVRLVLLVDGLDEDRSTASGVHAHSIAGLLPGDPPAGMRVIVAGRPNPPIPDDVPHWHPLRDPGIVRRLSASAYAQDLQRRGQVELKRLLKGSPVERDLLGLLTAARGGLSGPDLRELTGAELVEIEDVLHTVVGRTFTRRTAEWDPDSGPEVYLLGHEDLQQAATGYIGEPRLTGYRASLHAWAGTYRAPTDGRPPWPEGTPEYLLRGYPRMLATTGDVPRLVELATDPQRHDRMLDLSGGDVAALAEITTCQNLVLASPEPDLEAMLRLCIRRTDLTDRNSHIPAALPAVWVTLGQPARAEALARSMITRYGRVQALAAVARALAAAGDQDGARRLAEQAETMARSTTILYQQTETLTAVAEALAAAGYHDRAQALARSITTPYHQVQALAAASRVIVAAGDHDGGRRLAEQAETVARSVTDPDRQAEALAAAAEAIAVAGDQDESRRLAEQAETVARSVTDPDRQAWALLAVARAVIAAGDHDRAETVARSIKDCYQQAQALIAVAETLVAAGDHDRAETVARSITDSYQQARALAAVVGALVAAGDQDGARRLAEQAEIMTRWLTDSYWQAQALAAAAWAFAVAGEYDRAETVARSIKEWYQQAQALTAVAGVLAIASEYDQAERVARSIAVPYQQAEALAAAAKALVTAGDHDGARRLAEQAETVARSVIDRYQQARALAEVAGAVVAAGDEDGGRRLAEQAETAARLTTFSHQQAQALAAVAGALAAADDHDGGRRLAEQAETMARSVTDPGRQAWALLAVARGAIAAGDHDRAETVARSITTPNQRAQALAAVAGALAAAGDHDRAQHLAEQAEIITRS
ncbi:hypothetical protein, partial [Actinoplanes siamensis]